MKNVAFDFKKEEIDMTTIERAFRDPEGTVVTVRVECPQPPKREENLVFATVMMAIAVQVIADYTEVTLHSDPFKADMMAMRLVEIFREGIKNEMRRIRRKLDDVAEASRNGGQP